MLHGENIHVKNYLLIYNYITQFKIVKPLGVLIR